MSQTYRVNSLSYFDLASYAKSCDGEVEDKEMISRANQYLDQPNRFLGPLITELLSNGCFMIRSVCLDSPNDESQVGYQVAIETAPVFDDWKTKCSCESDGKCSHVLANLIYIHKTGQVVYVNCTCDPFPNLNSNSIEENDEMILAQDILNQREQYYNIAYQELHHYPGYF